MAQADLDDLNNMQRVVDEKKEFTQKKKCYLQQIIKTL